MGCRRIGVVFLALVLSACGTTVAPTPLPVSTSAPAATASPTLVPTPLPPPATGPIPAAGGTLAVPGGASLAVPAGALAAAATATITASAPDAGPTGAWPADAAGPAWAVDLGGAALAKPVTLTIPFDPAALPAGADPAGLLLAYRDPATGGWTPVPATVDAAARTVTASVDHLSTWGLFTINWDYWLGFIGKAASGNLTDLLGAFGTLTTACPETSGGFAVDNTAANGMIKGCVQTAAKGTATIGVTNMRLIAFALSGGALGAAGGTILDPGDTITFPAGGAKLAQPLVAGASLSKLALGYQLTDLLLRLLPGSGVFTHAGTYGKLVRAIAEEASAVWGSAKILDKLQASPPDVAGAAEEAFSLVTDHSFLGAFVVAAAKAGRQFGVPVLDGLTSARLNQAVFAANLLVLDATLLSWDVQYFLAGYGEVKVSWVLPPAAPAGVRLDCTWVGGAPPDVGVHECWVYPDTFTLRWNDKSTTETGFRIYGRASGIDLVCTPFDTNDVPLTAWKLLATVKAGQQAWHGLTFDAAATQLHRPKAPYYFRVDTLELAVVAFNDVGESPRATPVRFYEPGMGLCGDDTLGVPGR